MRTYGPRYLSLAAVLLAASPLRALAQEEAPLRMIYAVWKDSAGADKAIKNMSKGALDQVEAHAVLVKDKAGEVKVAERYSKPGSARAAQASQVVDTAIARLNRPIPSAADSVSGYAPNQPARRLSEEDLKKVVGMLGPGESALILLSPKPAVSQIQRFLGTGMQSDAEVIEIEVKD